MASAAEQLAANISLSTFSKATELKKRLWFTLGALVLFRLLSFVPIPGIDPRALASLFQTQQGGVLDFFNTFSGGSLERMSIIALGVMPYITASIVVQLAASLYEPWKALKKEGETGRKRLNQYTRYLTVAADHRAGLVHRRRPRRPGSDPGHRRGRRAGTAVPRRGDGQPGRRHVVPDVDRRADHQPRHRQWRVADHHGRHRRLDAASPGAAVRRRPHRARWTRCVVFGIVIAVVALVLFICFMERAQRRVLIQYPKRQTARGMMQQERSHLPLKINTAGVIPPIFASSLLLMPLTVLQFAGGNATSPDSSSSDWLITHQHLSAAWRAALPGALCGGHPLLLLLLHGGAVQFGRDGREFEAPRRLHSGHPSGQGDRAIFRLSAQPHHGDRRRLSGD